MSSLWRSLVSCCTRDTTDSNRSYKAKKSPTWTPTSNPAPSDFRDEWQSRCDAAARTAWLSHAGVVAQFPLKSRERPLTVLFDPHLYPKCSPIGGAERLIDAPCTPEQAAEMGVDLIALSHNHYDHMNQQTIEAFSKSYHTSKDGMPSQQPHFVIPEGNKSRLVGWGIEPDHVTEMKPWEQLRVDVDPVDGSLSFGTVSAFGETTSTRHLSPHDRQRDGKEKESIDHVEVVPALDSPPQTKEKQSNPPSTTASLIVEVDDNDVADIDAPSKTLTDQDLRSESLLITCTPAHHNTGRWDNPFSMVLPLSKCASWHLTYNPVSGTDTIKSSIGQNHPMDPVSLWFAGDTGSGSDSFASIWNRMGDTDIVWAPIAAGAATDILRLPPALFRKNHMQGSDPHKVVKSLQQQWYHDISSPYTTRRDRLSSQYCSCVSKPMSCEDEDDRLTEEMRGFEKTDVHHPFALAMHHSTFVRQATASKICESFDQKREKNGTVNFYNTAVGAWRGYKPRCDKCGLKYGVRLKDVDRF